MQGERRSASLIINTLAAAISMWAALTCYSAIQTERHRRRFSCPNVLYKVVLLRPQRKHIVIIIVTGLRCPRHL